MLDITGRLDNACCRDAAAATNELLLVGFNVNESQYEYKIATSEYDCTDDLLQITLSTLMQLAQTPDESIATWSSSAVNRSLLSSEAHTSHACYFAEWREVPANPAGLTKQTDPLQND